MNRRIAQILRPTFVRTKKILPEGLFSLIDRHVYRKGTTQSQIDKIMKLGKDIGLRESEVLTALGEPSSLPGFDGKQKLTLYFIVFLLCIVVTIAGLAIWTIVDPETSPIKTYVPGSLYGTIRPSDFFLSKSSTVQ